MRFDVFRVDGIIINIYFLFVKAIDNAKKKNEQNKRGGHYENSCF